MAINNTTLYYPLTTTANLYYPLSIDRANKLANWQFKLRGSRVKLARSLSMIFVKLSM